MSSGATCKGMDMLIIYAPLMQEQESTPTWLHYKVYFLMKSFFFFFLYRIES